MKMLSFIFMFVLLTACTFDSAAYEEQREKEHADHMKQNGY